MRSGRRIEAEITALRSALAGNERPAEAGIGPAGEASGGSTDGAAAAIQAVVDDLSTLAEEASDEVGETVRRHPVAAVAAAFALGLVIGRLSGRL